MLGLGNVKTIAGTIVQVSQSEIARGGIYYDFVTIDGDGGTVYKIRRLIAGADVNPDLVVGRQMTLYVQSFRTMFTWFVKRNVLHAVETDRGTSIGFTRAQKFGLLLVALVTTPISIVFTVIPCAMLTLIYVSFFGGGASPFWVLLLPIGLIVHAFVITVLILVSMSTTKARLTGLGSTRTVYDGRPVKEM